MSDGERAGPSFGQGRGFDIEHQLQGQISTRGETANGYVCSIDVQSSTLVFGELVGDAFPQFSVPRSFRVQDGIDDIFAIVVGLGELLVRPQSVIHADDDTSEVSTQLRTKRCLLRRRTQDHASSMMVEHNGDMRRPRFDGGIRWDEDGYRDGPIRSPAGDFDGDRVGSFRVGVFQRQVRDEPGRRDQGFTPVDAPGVVVKS